jgi:pantoate--beta-alanine ligase
MEIVKEPEELRRLSWDWRCGGARTALVPTMGYFHAGHLSLMRWAREHADRVVVSLFVNPTQFGPGEDLAAYPRDFERDASLAEAAGADVLFAPEPDGLYPPGFATWVEVPDLGRGLCGRSRPIHFRGVATVVSKLLLLALPRLAVFGQKDWQQLAIIRRMARDLGFPTDIVGHPIVREPDGLAMSSRNVYLTPGERAAAPNIQAGLRRARDLAASGERRPSALLDDLRSWYANHVPEGRIDYLELVDPDTVAPVAALDGPALLAVAMQLGRARLIDNLIVE